MEASWYAIQVKTRREPLVTQRLAGNAIHTFLPLLEIARRYGMRRTAVLEPLFPGYVFAQLNGDTADWYAVRWTPGVRRIVGTGDTPVPVPAEVIEAIRDRIKVLGFVRPGLRFAPGSRVRIQRGPLEGVEAAFQQPLNGSKRVRVLLDLLGQPRRVDLDAVDVSPI